MSIQAVAWVLSQPVEDLPVIPRAIMFALANHADHTDGHCWPAIETIAKEAGVGERTVSRYLGALVRNGFIDKRQKNTKGHFRANDYWILFDRQPAKWGFFEPKDDDPDPHAREADGSEDGLHETRTPLEADGRTPLVADAIDEPSDSNHQSPGVVEGPTIEPPASAPAPNGFDPNARQRQQDRLNAADEARRPKHFPVIRGTPAWHAWVKAGHAGDLYATIEVNGRKDWGWYFPTLWPGRPMSETGPPATAPPDPTRKTG